MYIYYNNAINSFIFTNKKQSGIKLSDEELMTLVNKNLTSVIKYIIKHNWTTSFFYFSTTELKKLSMPIIQEHKHKSLYNKPQGLWVSCGIEWLEYVKKNYNVPNKYNLFSYTYKLELYDNVKMINDKEGLMQFIKKYKKKSEFIRVYDIIDWERVRNDYAGLVITPHLGNKIWHESYNNMRIEGAEAVHDFFVDLLGQNWKNKPLLLCEWYRSWEVASGVIWNSSGIASFDLIKETNYNKYIN